MIFIFGLFRPIGCLPEFEPMMKFVAPLATRWVNGDLILLNASTNFQGPSSGKMTIMSP